jgi:hypothetical protein
MSHFLPSTPQLILIVALGLMTMVLWRRSNKHFGRGGKAYEAPHRLSKLDNDRDVALADAPTEVTRWQVEMYELARETKAEIDTKLTVLQVLLRQTNEATARLDQAIRRAERLGLDRTRDPLAAIEQWDANAAETPVDEALAPADVEAIYRYADQGEAPSAIAMKTGMPLGEVELALSLRVSR